MLRRLLRRLLGRRRRRVNGFQPLRLFPRRLGSGEGNCVLGAFLDPAVYRIALFDTRATDQRDYLLGRLSCDCIPRPIR